MNTQSHFTVINQNPVSSLRTSFIDSPHFLCHSFFWRGRLLQFCFLQFVCYGGEVGWVRRRNEYPTHLRCIPRYILCSLHNSKYRTTLNENLIMQLFKVKERWAGGSPLYKKRGWHLRINLQIAYQQIQKRETPRAQVFRVAANRKWAKWEKVVASSRSVCRSSLHTTLQKLKCVKKDSCLRISSSQVHTQGQHDTCLGKLPQRAPTHLFRIFPM